MPRRRNTTPEERARLRAEKLERSSASAELSLVKADAAQDAMVRKSIEDHGA